MAAKQTEVSKSTNELFCHRDTELLESEEFSESDYRTWRQAKQGIKGEGHLKMATNPHCDAETIADILPLFSFDQLLIQYSSVWSLEILILESECDNTKTMEKLWEGT